MAGSLTGVTYDIWVRDAGGCPASTSAAIIQLNPDLPLLDPVVDNQCDVTATAAGGFDITLSLPGDFETPTFTLNGISQTVAHSGNPAINTTATFTVNSVESYAYNIIDANGCEVDGVAEVYQVLTASGDFTIEPNCEEEDGTITITSDGGSGNFNYTLTGTDFDGNPVSMTILDDGDDAIFNDVVDFTSVPPGTYDVIIEDQIVRDGVGQCSTSVNSIIRSAPISPEIFETGETDVSCNGLGDGSISASIVAGTDVDGIKEYNLYISDLASMPGNYDATSRFRTEISGSFTGLDSGTYVLEVVTDRNCFDREEVVIIDSTCFYG
ncbi:hypothetical protein ACU8V7_22430 [Zobellia nedashkovskayae]